MSDELDANVLLSREAALDHVQGDEEFLEEIYRIFLDEIPGRVEMFKRALRDSNLKELISLAHSLKGVSLTIGAGSCHHLSARMELAARAEDFETVQKLYPELERILLNLEEQLRAEIEESS